MCLAKMFQFDIPLGSEQEVIFLVLSISLKLPSAFLRLSKTTGYNLENNLHVLLNVIANLFIDEHG